MIVLGRRGDPDVADLFRLLPLGKLRPEGFDALAGCEPAAGPDDPSSAVRASAPGSACRRHRCLRLAAARPSDRPVSLEARNIRSRMPSSAISSPRTCSLSPYTGAVSTTEPPNSTIRLSTWRSSSRLDSVKELVPTPITGRRCPVDGIARVMSPDGSEAGERRGQSTLTPAARVNAAASRRESCRPVLRLKACPRIEEYYVIAVRDSLPARRRVARALLRHQPI
jgi:hypothetical protein